MCVCVLCECMSACSGEADCESSFVTHKASAIKAAHFITLSYGKNTHMDGHPTQEQAANTHMLSVTLFKFSQNDHFKFWSFHHSLLSPQQTHDGTFLTNALKTTHTQTQQTSFMLTPPYVGLGVVADAKTRGTS